MAHNMPNSPSGTSSSSSSSNKDESSDRVSRWHFNPNSVYIPSLNESIYICTHDEQPPLKIKASTRYTSFLLDVSNIALERSDVILAVSTKGLHIDKVESITITCNYNYDTSAPVAERILNKGLKKLASSGSEVVLWRLPTQKYVDISDEFFRFTMEIKSTSGSHSSEENGHIELHYIEYRKYQRTGRENDPQLCDPQPNIWSLNALRDKGENTESYEAQPSVPMSFAVSGDGNYIAFFTKSNSAHFIDLWDVRSYEASSKGSNTGTFLDPIPCTSLRIPDAPKGNKKNLLFTISVSWDASYIAYSDATPLGESLDLNQSRSKGASTIYKRQNNQQVPADPPSSINLRFKPMTNLENIPGLSNISGHGKFNSTSMSRGMESEVFVTCDGETVKVYSIHPQWSHLRTIVLTTCPSIIQGNMPQRLDTSSIQEARRLIESLKGKYFAWNGNPNYMVSVYNIEDGSIVSSFRNIPIQNSSTSIGYDVPVEFSNDGSQLVIHGNGVIKTFLTNTGENIGTYNIPDWCKTIHSFRFIKHNTQILVETLSGNDMFGKGRLGIVLKNPTVRSRVPSIIQEDVILCPGTFIKALPTLDADGKQRLLSVSGLMINLNVIDDYIVSKYIHPEQHWNKTCIEQLKPLSECPEEFTTPSGLNFKVEIRFTPSAIPGNVRSAPSVIVTTTAGNRRREFEIPPYFIKSGASHGYQCARILDINLQLVVISTTLIMIWKLPSTIDGEFSLLLYWDTPINIQANVNLIDITLDDEWWNGVSGPWHICSHQKLRAVFEFDGDQKVLTPSAEDPLAEKMSFHTPLSYNVHLLYAEANEACRKAIVRYFGLHMNSYSSHDNDTFHVLELIARFWQPILQIQFEAFVGDLLDGTNGTWIPPECQDYKNNPLSILYEKVKKNPRAIVVAETIIDHCIRHSRLEKNPLIIQPVIRTLGKLLDPKIHQPDIALRTLQRLAFLRAVNRLYIIDNHTIALPPLARLRFWDKESQMLFRCKNPILQLNLSPGAPNPLNENFTKDLFEAWFEMIWSVKGGSESCGTHYSQSNRTVIGPLFHWIFVMMCIFWCKCRPWSEKHIKSHDFTLESLDNPAIAALIEYKWNVIGYKYWLVRFFSQLVYYSLIVFVIVKQVNNERLEPLWGICVTIIACSTIFLLLEVGQVIRDKKSYFSSFLYNIVDLGTFGLPLAASINHLLVVSDKVVEESNIGLFSFSILFIFLHTLLELRVVKSVCYFTTIIIQAIRKIKVFFFIFAFGIIAFTVANIHLLRGCSFTGCGEFKTKFPDSPFTAISTTYFFMGGRYDQIEDEMNNKESWAFQALMIIFFFFTVILMLNVLIALINKAFNDGDETWRLVWLENRLRTIESAEDISFKIPGFRESHNWFPESIYYSASSQQIRAYELKYFENNGEFTTDQNGVVRNNDALEVPMNVYLKTSVQPGFFNFIDTPEEQAARNGIAGKSAAVGHEGALPTSNPNPNNNQSAATTQDAEVEPSYSDNQANIDNQSENITQLQQSFATVQQELAQSRSEVLELQTQLLAQNTRLEAQLKEQSQQLLEQNRQLKEQNSQFQENLQAVLSEFLKSNLKEM